MGIGGWATPREVPIANTSNYSIAGRRIVSALAIVVNQKSRSAKAVVDFTITSCAIAITTPVLTKLAREKIFTCV
jgi:hypothetical protein